jgi:hypothetical protein
VIERVHETPTWTFAYSRIAATSDGSVVVFVRCYRMPYRTLGLLQLAIVLTLGCGASSTPPRPALNQPPARCLPATIEEYCATRTCSSYADEVAFVHAPHEGRFFYSIGTCGEDRFVTIQEGMGSMTDYFNPSGRLVGTSSVADAAMCTGEMSYAVGVGSACSQTVVESGGHQDGG